MERTSPPKTFCQHVIATANAHQDNVAMTLVEPHRKETTTFGSMLAQVRSIAYRLSEEGVAFGHIANAREWVVWELENLGRELPEYQRVHDFVLRAEPLPRTTTRKLKRFELASELQTLRNQTNGKRESKASAISEADQVLMDTPGGRATIAAVKQHLAESKLIDPQMNLEIDLGLDSLARAECLVSVEQNLGIEVKPEEAATVQTVAELARLANRKIGTGPAAGQLGATNFHGVKHWHSRIFRINSPRK